MTTHKTTKNTASDATPPAPNPVLPAADAMRHFPIVGIGASAGGLRAFEAFFAGLPANTDPGMAFVLVQHLDPNNKSILSEILQRHTRMSVVEVEDGMKVEPNHVYVIAPNHDMALINGTLQLLEPITPRGQRLPIDFFFQSMAQDLAEQAIGIILSGTGSDGSLGIRAIKEEGGMVMVQIPTSAEFDGMPRSALNTSSVDYTLAPADMAAQLITYVDHAFSQLPKLAASPKAENAIKKLFVLLRNQTSHDFSQYKPSTIHRRIERRMAVNQIDSLEDYVRYLQHTPAEVGALFRDLLIGVTHFFRDKEAFQALEQQIIPKLFEQKQSDDAIRVWSTGCSTGEEAYSLAILLQEHMEALRQSYTIQVFATDIDSRAIATARAGLYPASIAEDMSPERLARYFVAELGGNAYRIHKSIRDMLIFSEQNMIKDPPFSRLDLISCRNLLIYLDADLQKRVIPLFHYALKPGGTLFLGTSEGIGEFSDLFTVLDRKAKLYQRKDAYSGSTPMPLSNLLLTQTATSLTHQPQTTPTPPLRAKLSLRELTEQTLLQQIVMAGVLINGQGDILYLHGRTGMFLEPAQGESGINNILKMARDGLHRDLSIALHKSVETRMTVHMPNLNVKTNGHYTRVNLTLCPVVLDSTACPDAPLFLVMLENASGSAPEPMENWPVNPGTNDAEARIALLLQEMRAQDEYLKSIREELQSSNEELKSSNEEMQSMNEELQSSNEELETSREELQSINEELSTVNTELQTKVMDLSHANNDMNNLLAGTGIGTVFVDHQLCVMRFTPAASTIINLIPSDVGRPVAHIVSNLQGYNICSRISSLYWTH